LTPGSYWLIHLNGPVTSGRLEQLWSNGLEPVGYLAYQNLVCRVQGDCRPPLASGEWLVPFLPQFKLAPELLAGDSSNSLQMVLALWPGEEPEEFIAAVESAGGRVITHTSHTILFTGTVSQARHLAQLDGVAWVQEAAPAEPFNSNVQWVVQTGWHPEIPDPIEGRRIWAHGIKGQGMVVGLFDSGILTGHNMFRDSAFPISGPGIFPSHRKIAAYKLYRDADFGDAGGAHFHGSGVAGTLAGSDSLNANTSPNDGMAPEARIYFVDNGTVSGRYIYYDDLTELLDSVRLSRGMTEPVPQVSGSFGTMDAPSYYRLADATVDVVCWDDKRFLVIWAAGNGGGLRFKLGHPACAKNNLTVGGCGNGIYSSERYSLSSAGPCRDDRLKPNIVAPAESITTVFGPDSACYSIRQGTSFAAPAASGALLLLRQYLKEGWFPYGQPGSGPTIDRPSSALMRALAIAAADSDVGADPTPNNLVGWGRLNLSKVMHFPDDSVAVTFVDETVGLATGYFHEFQFELNRREPLTVVLAWTDTAAAPAAAIALVNDLNLELQSPDNNRYRGNQLLMGQSLPNPPNWDERNVEEVCHLRQPITGRWTARVYARNVFTPLQSYALVVKGGIAGLPPAGTPSSPFGSRHTSRSCGSCQVVTSARPLRLHIPAGAGLQLFNAAGQRIWQKKADAPGVQELLLTYQDFPAAGVYYYQITPAYIARPLTGKLLLLP
ncbi:MAG: S8 family serine peptidase, partial [candidate division WOR-3 bacterium]